MKWARLLGVCALYQMTCNSELLPHCTIFLPAAETISISNLTLTLNRAIKAPERIPKHVYLIFKWLLPCFPSTPGRVYGKVGNFSITPMWASSWSERGTFIIAIVLPLSRGYYYLFRLDLDHRVLYNVAPQTTHSTIVDDSFAGWLPSAQGRKLAVL